MNAPAAGASAAIEKPLSRADYEDFLYNEAALLDEWRMDEWFALFLEGAIYEVPCAGAPDNADSSEDLFYISDNYFRLGHRVARMNKESHHSEFPHSSVTRMIGNVRVLGADQSGVSVGCTFVTHRSKNDVLSVYCGHHRYVLRAVEGRIRIVSKRTFLDLNSLRPQGRVSIIV
ncbi:MAG: aromatic-ring-hydroxylating dioxygenase subunit beta [Hyphomicrobiales bacterium]|nr:aromatic-ring-hydroxylating dioxygenase subunit beta [Hyphomicrobiales bacterium]